MRIGFDGVDQAAVAVPLACINSLETPNMLLKDQVALITGGAGLNGLGFATARLMAAQGARVVICDLERADPAGAAAQLGAGHLGLVADVTDKASCEAAVQAALQAFGRIDTLVNNAGITQPVKTLEITGSDYDRILDVSLRGTLYMSQAVLPAITLKSAHPAIQTAMPPKGQYQAGFYFFDAEDQLVPGRNLVGYRVP